MAHSQQSSGGHARHGGHGNWDERLREMHERGAENLMDGALTAGYKANKEEVIEILNRALAGEWASFLQYWHHAAMATDIHSAEVKDEWLEHAEDEYKHAQMFMTRVKQLGGIPANDPKQIAELAPDPFEPGHDLRSMIEADLAGERSTIEFYSEAIRLCGFDDIETRTLFEKALHDECHHADELADFLGQINPSTGDQIPTVHEKVLELGHSGGQRPGESGASGEHRRAA